MTVELILSWLYEILRYFRVSIQCYYGILFGAVEIGFRN